MNYQLTIIGGHLTRDPELKYLASGQALTTFSVASNRYYKNAEGEKQEEVLFLRTTVWGKQAETVAEYLSKGSPVLVQGYLKENSWTAEDGTEKRQIELVADRVQFVGGKKDSDE